MSSQQCVHCSSASNILFCPSERKFFCKSCYDKHLSSLIDHYCQANYLCEECEQKHAECFCIGCDQKLCDDCSLNLHKKGARAQHIRNKLDLPLVNNYHHQEENLCLVLLDKNFWENNKNFLMKLLANQNVFFIFILENQEEETAFAEKMVGEMGVKEENKIQYLSFVTNNEKNLYQFLETNDQINANKNVIKKIMLMDEITKIFNRKSLEELLINKEKSVLKQAQMFIIVKDALKEVKNIEDFKSTEIPYKSEITEKGNLMIKQEDFAQISVINKNTSIHILNNSYSSFETSALFIGSQNPLNQSFNNVSFNNHSLDLNSSIEPNILNRSENLHPFSQSKSPFVFPYMQKFKSVELKGSIQISFELQREMRKYAEEAELLLSRNRYLEIIQKLCKANKIEDFDSLAKEAEKNNIIHQTIRKFEGYPEKHELYSLSLDQISYESLTWILKTIRKDSMTPTEKIIISRIKECFGLKITPKQWETIIFAIKNNKFQIDINPFSSFSAQIPSININANHNNLSNKGSSSNTGSLASQGGSGSMGSKGLGVWGSQNMDDGLAKILISKIKDPLVGTETLILKFKGIDWHVEDQGKVEEDKDGLWKVFVGFLNNFFKQQRMRLEEIPEKTSESEANISGGGDFPPLQSESDSSRSIPGGRYGCAQFIKICAPEDLRKCSLGRLNLYVQEAINKGLIKYHRTLLVKDYSRDEEYSYLEGNISLENQEKSNFLLQREAKIKALQKTLLEILKENPQGIALAQIPQFLKMRTPFSFNLQDLGFPKLKNFLASLPEKVKIEMAGTNNSFAYLLDDNNNKYYKANNFQNPSSFLRNNGGLSAMGISSPKLNCDRMVVKKKYNTLKFPVNESKLINERLSRKKVSSIEEYLSKIVNVICAILNENTYGIRVNRLYDELNKRLGGVEFDFRLFECIDFYNFLTKYLESENLIYIEIKNYELFVFPKNFRINDKQLKPEEISKNKYTNLNLNSEPFSYNENLQKQGLNLNPAASYTPFQFNPISPLISQQFEEDFYAQHKKSLTMANYGSNSSSFQNNIAAYPNLPLMNQPRPINSSSVSSSHNRNVSFWNLNVPTTLDPNINHSPSNSKQLKAKEDESVLDINEKNNVTLKSPPKQVKKNEDDSALEINENIRLIEKLLIENDDVRSLKTYSDNGSNFSFSSYGFPNFGMMSAIKNDYTSGPNEKMHSKARSDDFDLNKKKFDDKNKQHGRVQSNFEQNKLFNKEEDNHIDLDIDI